MTKYDQFAALHRPGDPLVLFNIWDAGSAQAVAAAGAKAIATGSASVARSQGFDDGEALPLDTGLATLKQIVAATQLPVSIDLEGGYGAAPETVAETARRAVEAGAVGFNFEDQIIGGDGMYDRLIQCSRIAAMRAATGPNAWINARHDIFLQTPAADHDTALVAGAIAHAKAFADAGGSSFFAPGLIDVKLIETLCAQSPLPVNIMASPAAPNRATLAALGVARISHGPFPWRDAMAGITNAAKAAMA